MMLAAVATGALSSVIGFYYGFDFTREKLENKEKVYRVKFVEKEEYKHSDHKSDLVKISFR